MHPTYSYMYAVVDRLFQTYPVVPSSDGCWWLKAVTMTTAVSKVKTKANQKWGHRAARGRDRSSMETLCPCPSLTTNMT